MRGDNIRYRTLLWIQIHPILLNLVPNENTGFWWQKKEILQLKKFAFQTKQAMNRAYHVPIYVSPSGTYPIWQWEQASVR
jgi:hypothetical protein